MATLEGKKNRFPMGFNLSEKECIWMKARVVQVKYCDNAFDCSTCEFDKVMGRKLMKEPEQKDWRSKMLRKLSPQGLMCRHALMGGASQGKKCTNAYDCANCAYDQMLDDTMLTDYTTLGPPQYFNAHGYIVPRDYYIHTGHAWARLEYGGRVRIGLDDFSNRLVGKVEQFRLPSLGTRLSFDDESFLIRRDNHEVGTRAPLNGVVTAVNQKLLDHPESTNQDPYCAGWVFLMDPMELRSDLKKLFFGVDSVTFIESEAERLLSLITDDPKAAAATGGEPIKDVYGAFRGMGWDNLVKRFF